MMTKPYPIIEVNPAWVLEPETLGSKEKFWYRRSDDEEDWLFKYPQINTGLHWAEKIAAEIAQVMVIPHAKVELATFQGCRGSVTRSFVLNIENLSLGNQILAGKVLGYDPKKEFRQSDHTLKNIFHALDKTFTNEEGRKRTKLQIGKYLILDAVIGNTDRHHENWGIVMTQPEPGKWVGLLAPSFDHASSLGRELQDEGSTKSRSQILKEGIGKYSEKARGAIYWSNSDKHGLSPLELIRKGAAQYPEYIKPRQAIANLSRNVIERIVQRIPDNWISMTARKFAVELMWYNITTLRDIANE